MKEGEAMNLRKDETHGRSYSWERGWGEKDVNRVFMYEILKKWNNCKNKNKAKGASWVWRIFNMFPDSSELIISFSPVVCNSIQADKLTIIFFLDKCCVDVRIFLNKKVHFTKGTEVVYSEPWNKTIFYTSQFEHIWGFFFSTIPLHSMEHKRPHPPGLDRMDRN